MFLSTPPSRVATEHGRPICRWLNVSIHATLAGGDDCKLIVGTDFSSFYPRHPRGWRPFGEEFVVAPEVFLSTPPSRVATGNSGRFGFSDKSFYPRHPRGWRLQHRDDSGIFFLVSIHATLAGGDAGRNDTPLIDRVFLSTPPSRVATWGSTIHSISSRCFYPRHPRGWRLFLVCCQAKTIPFLSTPPSRVATLAFPFAIQSRRCFYPRHPRGWRLPSRISIGGASTFLSTPPSRVATIG